MAPNEVWQLTVQGNVSGTQHIHSLHFLEGIAAGDGPGLVTKWQGAPQTAYRLLFQTTANPVQQITARKVCGSLPLPAPTVVVPATAAQAGTRAASGGNNMPPYVAAQVAEKGELAGRRYSGRFFLGGINENDVNESVLEAGYISIVNNYLAALATAFIGALVTDWHLFAFSSLLAEGDPLHTKKNPTPPPERIADPVTAVACQDAGSVVTALVLNPRPTTMRSRKFGRGL